MYLFVTKPARIRSNTIMVNITKSKVNIANVIQPRGYINQPKLLFQQIFLHSTKAKTSDRDVGHVK